MSTCGCKIVNNKRWFILIVNLVDTVMLVVLHSIIYIKSDVYLYSYMYNVLNMILYIYEGLPKRNMYI